MTTLTSVYFPLSRLPLNPNGKVDKPALPFPDTSIAVAAPSTSKLSPTQKTIHDIWRSLLPSAPAELALDDNFFDMGGHSILATRLIFEIRKAFVVNAPLGMVFDMPTIESQAAEVEKLRNADLGIGNGETTKAPASAPTEVDYAKDVAELATSLPARFDPLPADFTTKQLTVFLTGATGFLGAFVLRDLLALRSHRVKKVICLVRGKSVEQGLARLREGSEGRNVWDEEWVTSGKVEVVTGDLAEEKFGLDDATWTRVAEDADAVLHNGAMVRATVMIELMSGSLGLPVCQASRCQRDFNTHCFDTLLNPPP